MTLVSQGKPINGVLCVVPSASSGSAWYALFTLLWWVQGVAPATSTRVGWLEQQCMDPSTAEPRSRVSSPWPHLIPRHKLVNLFPKGEWHPFLYKLSDLIYYLTQFHLLWNPIPPYLRQICWDTCFIMGGGLPYTILYREELWDCGVILSLSSAVGSKSTQEQSASKIHMESLFTCPVGSFHHPRTLGPRCCV